MKKVKHYAKEILFFIITMTIIANMMSIYRSQELAKEPLSISSFELLDKSVYHVKSDKPLLIHFWATWCPTCNMEASNIEFLSKYFEVITIAVKSGSDEDIKKYLKEHNYHFRVFNDSSGVVAQEFHVSGFPTTFIYDKKSTLRFSEVGYTSTLGLYLRILWAGQ